MEFTDAEIARYKAMKEGFENGEVFIGIDPSHSTGFDKAPDRYMGQGRETIDRIRDMCRHHAEINGQHIAMALDEENWSRIGDLIFHAFCEASALKYADRAGRKGDPTGDQEKHRWYTQMAVHADGQGPDPRSDRPNFTPYTPEKP